MRHKAIILSVLGVAITSGSLAGCATCDLRVASLARSYRNKNIAVVNLGRTKEDEVKFDGWSVTWDTSNTVEMTHCVERALMDSTIYKIIDRSKLEKVLTEQDLQASSLVDPETAARAGKLAGLNSIVLVRPKGYCKLVLLFLYISKTAQVRMIDVETATVVWSGEVKFTDSGIIPLMPSSLIFTSAENRMADKMRDQLEKVLFVW